MKMKKIKFSLKIIKEKIIKENLRFNNRDENK
jgi:hypothetical protein